MTSHYDTARSRIDSLLSDDRQIIIGLAGAPGCGKSTLASRLAEDYGDIAVVVPMDGFHLANTELIRLGRQGRKGAPDTFDAEGFVSLLQRIRTGQDEIVYAPYFDRDIEEAIAGAIPVPADRRLVIVEGNYLLCDGHWAKIRTLLDESWFIATDETLRNVWLEARHIRFGRSVEQAKAWIAGTDAPNARIVLATKDRADWIYCSDAS